MVPGAPHHQLGRYSVGGPNLRAVVHPVHAGERQSHRGLTASLPRLQGQSTYITVTKYFILTCRRWFLVYYELFRIIEVKDFISFFPIIKRYEFENLKTNRYFPIWWPT